MAGEGATPSISEPFNLADPRLKTDPWPVYREAREAGRIIQSGRGFSVLTGYADCLAVLRDKRASSDSNNIDAAKAPKGFTRAAADARAAQLGLTRANDARPFLFLDPPDHTRLRSLVAKAFTPKVVESLRPRAHEITAELLAAALEKGEVDLVEALAQPLPVRIICELLDIPSADHEQFGVWSQMLARGLDPDFLMSDEMIVARNSAVLSFAGYFHALLAERRRRPGADLLSQLVAAEEAGDRLSEAELLSTCILLLVAGHETTVNLLAGGTLALAQHRDEYERFRTDPTLARSAIDELMRFVSPVQLTGRTLLDDIELEGHHLEGGTFVLLLIASANRDPVAFNQPERLDLARSPNPHLGFGFGLHHCLGAPLARMEAQVALEALVTRCELELRSSTFTYRDQLVLRGLAELPVTLAPR